MKRSILLLLSTTPTVHPFATIGRRTVTNPPSPRYNALPTLDEVSKDDFMKQLGHASRLLPLLHPPHGTTISEEESLSLRRVLEEQFRRSEGIRGFFAVYLTSLEALSEEEEDAPRVLREAVVSADAEIMVPLACMMACMNVVMPTAMTSRHTHPDLKECAAKTARNGKKILRWLRGHALVEENCRAIVRVCEERNGPGEEELVKYWDSFFGNYKYGPMEKEAISLALAEFC